MPYIFSSRKEFSYWFANPMTSMIEGKSNKNENVVNRLHDIIRPFVLRRLKKDVETQLPGKFEHIVKCQLSRRQVCSLSCSVDLGLLLNHRTDVHLRRVHGSLLDTQGSEKGRQLFGYDDGKLIFLKQRLSYHQ